MDNSNPNQKDLDSLKECQPFLSSVSTRRIIVIEADNPDIGKIALVYIGMADISSCLSEVQKGQIVKKGEELGYFEIGGSSHCIIFESKAKLKFSQLYE